MEVALFTPSARIALLLAAAVLGVAAVVAGWRRRAAPRGTSQRLRLDRWLVATASAALASALALVGERVVGRLAFAVAPAGADFNEWRWVLLSPWGRTTIAVGLAVAGVTLFLGWRGTAREPSLVRRAALLALRAGACCAALVLFLQPALELRHVRREPNHVLVLVDDSRSMGLAERPGEPTRAERARGLVERSAPAFERWRTEHHVDFFTFSDTLVPATEAALSAAVTPRADATLMGEAIEALRARFDGQDLAGVVIVSDGAPTGHFAGGVDSGATQDFLASLDARVHTAWVGRSGLQDLSVARVDADEFAFVRTVVKVEAVIRAAGFPRQHLPVVLRREGQVVRESFVEVGGDTPEARVAFEFTPERVGKTIYEIAIPVDAAEVVPGNNTRAFVLRVIREKVRVLLVAGRPSWDERAVRALLKADPNVDLVSFFILRTWDDVQLVGEAEMSLIPFPTEELFEEQLGSFDLILLMNFEYGPYRIGPYLENLRRFVEEGGGLAMVGGDLSFSSGGYAGTALAEVLPVELLPETASPESLLDLAEFRPRLTGEGRRHPVTQLRFERRANDARWGALPLLEGLNLVAGLRPGATALAVHPSLKTPAGEPMPVLAVADHGKGRTLALLTDTAWRMGFVAARRPGDDGRAFQTLWDNAARWLIHDPEFEHLQVLADRAHYEPGESPRVAARLVDKDYEPAPAAEVVFNVSRQVGGGKVEPVLERKTKTDDAGELRLDVPVPGPGAYRVQGKARVDGRTVSAEDVFLVDPERVELERPEAREDILKGIASATGGRALSAVDALPANLPFAPPRVVRVDRRSDVELWSRPGLLILSLAFLGLEWTLRRRRGYL